MGEQENKAGSDCCTKAGALLFLGLGGDPEERCGACGCTAQQILDDPTVGVPL